MSDWKIIIPEVATNLLPNPSVENAITGWSNAGSGATVARAISDSKYGTACIKVTCNGAVDQAAYTTGFSIDATKDIGLSTWFKKGSISGAATIHFTVRWTGGTNPDATVEYASEGSASGFSADWEYLSRVVTPDYSDRTGMRPYLRVIGANTTEIFYIDAYMVENSGNSYVTTYIDGDQPGCKWNGTPHASTSTRTYDANGGRLVDLHDDLGFKISTMQGFGLPGIQNNTFQQTLKDGELFDNQVAMARQFSLLGTLKGNDTAGYHDTRQKLLKALNVRTGRIDQNQQPRILRYTGAAVEKEIKAVYQQGLGGLVEVFSEKDVPLTFLAPRPVFEQVGESASQITTKTSTTLRYVAAKRDGLWDDLGPPAAATAFSLITTVISNSQYLYVAGNFTGFSGVTNANHIARMNLETGVWSALGTGMNGTVNDLAIDSQGRLWATGSFTTAGGGAANFIAVWNGSTWAAAGSGLGSSGFALATYQDKVFVCGGFTTAGGGSANYVAVWNISSSTWSALGSGLNALAYDVVVSQTTGLLYIGGNFTTAGGSAAVRLAIWDITNSSWSAMGGGANNNVFCFAEGQDGIVYFGGAFSQIDGSITCNGVGAWNGSQLYALNDGVNNVVNGMAIDKNDILWLVGTFSQTTISGKSLNGLATYNGSVVSVPDITPPGSISVKDVFVPLDDDGSREVMLVFDTTGTGTYAGSTVIDYEGTEDAFPTFTIKRTGGTGARLLSLVNVSTNAKIYFDYNLLDGEMLKMYFTPDGVKCESSFYGEIQAWLSNSDVAKFFLVPGNDEAARENTITCFVIETGSPTIEAYMVWRNAYFSAD